MKIRHISTRFALLLALAAVVPLVAYGIVSILSLQQGTRETVIDGNHNVAARAAEEIQRYIATNAQLLKALAADLQNTELEAWQQDRILKNYVLQFREFRELTLFAEDGSVVATSRVGKPEVTVPGAPAPGEVEVDGVRMSPISIDADQLPTTVFAIRLTRLNTPAGWLVGEFRLEEMWRTVDQIRLGEHGFALVLAPDGTLIAHGDPDKKALVAQSANLSDHPLFGRTAGDAEYESDGQGLTLAVAAPIPSLDWTVIVEQPVAEAFAIATQLERQLVVVISLALFAMISLGYLFGRSFINPIHLLQRATAEVAAGHLETRVDIQTGDEFSDLGHSFNTMADRLVQLQEDVKRQERQAMFGRVAAGLVHDLSHPVQNIGNSVALLRRGDIDDESRVMFQQTIERELSSLKRFLDDLRNLVRPKPIERFAMDINASVAEIVEPLKAEGQRHGVAVEITYGDGPLVIDGDRFALGRVYRNLVTNAIQATEAGGRVVVGTARVGDHIEVTITDTGSGIAPERLSAIFDDFMTTKRRGLGLGLAISKRIVEQLDGTITVQSEVGRGTTFALRFPQGRQATAEAAAS